MKALRDLSQLLMLRLEENRWTASLERLLRNSPPGGVLISAPLPRSPELTGEFLHKIARTLSRPPFLAVREEGGAKDPLREFFPRLPSPRAAGEKGLAAVARLGELVGAALSLLGFNTNFAPLLDLSTPFTGKALGARTFGSDPEQVSQCGDAFLRGLERHKILACGKHFPGGGSVPAQTSRGLPSDARRAQEGLAISGKSMAALWREDLLPYRRLLPRLPMVLVSEAAYKAYDFDQPRAASLSALVVGGLLRVKLGYRGLALAYNLESKDVRGALDLGDAAIQSLNAGCDVLILDNERSFEVARRAFGAALESAKLSRQRVEESLERIRVTQKRLALPTGKVPRRARDELARRFESFSREFRPEELKIA